MPPRPAKSAERWDQMQKLPRRARRDAHIQRIIETDQRENTNFARFLVPPSSDVKRSAPRCSDPSAASRQKAAEERSAQLAAEERVAQLAAEAKQDRIRRFYMRLRHMTFLNTLLRQERAQAEEMHSRFVIERKRQGYRALAGGGGARSLFLRAVDPHR